MTSESSYSNQSSGPQAFYVYDWEDGAIVTLSRADLDRAQPTRFFVTKRLDTAIGYAIDEATKRLRPGMPPGNSRPIRAAP